MLNQKYETIEKCKFCLNLLLIFKLSRNLRVYNRFLLLKLLTPGPTIRYHILWHFKGHTKV